MYTQKKKTATLTTRVASMVKKKRERKKPTIINKITDQLSLTFIIINLVIIMMGLA